MRWVEGSTCQPATENTPMGVDRRLAASSLMASAALGWKRINGSGSNNYLFLWEENFRQEKIRFLSHLSRRHLLP
jgi:hypothetical protein